MTVAVLPAAAQPARPAPVPTVQDLSGRDLPAPLNDVRFDQRLGEALPLDLALRDEGGREVLLGDYFGERPVVLAPVYFDCPMLCTLVLSGLTATVKTLGFSPGDELEVVVFSFDPSETPAMAAAEKERTVERLGRPETADGWHFLTGDAEAIARLTAAIGFHYTEDEATGEWAHVAGLVVATPEGKLARYLFGVEYPGLRLALVEAADERIGSLAEQIYLYCFRYDPATAKYSAVTMNIVRLAGALTVVLLGLTVAVLLLRERRTRLLGTT